ncbi:MAG: hypothetical protein OXN21_04195 [Chloroflexota bacterium]|nr:hypothetical protein [Chloroflexota bacterium]
MSDNKALAGLFVLAILGLAIAAVPIAARLSLLWLYIEPNPRHMPPVLTGEAVGWGVIGLLTGAAVVIVSESIFWHHNRSLWTKYRGLIIGAIVSMVAGVTLGIFFAIIQMDSVDGQAMETKQLAALAGATASGICTTAGIFAGTVVRRYVVGLYRLPQADQPSRITFNDEDATGSRRAARERSTHAGEHS